MNMIFIMLVHVLATEHVSRHGEIFTGDMRYVRGDSLSTDQPELPSTCVYETIPSLSHIEDSCRCSAVCVQMNELALMLGCPRVYCCFCIESIKVTDGVGHIHDEQGELAVVSLLQTYGTCSCAACANIERDRNTVISVNHVDSVCSGQASGETVEVLLAFCQEGGHSNCRAGHEGVQHVIHK